jgi:hypothetical protein
VRPSELLPVPAASQATMCTTHGNIRQALWASTGWFYRPALGSGLTAVKPSLVGMLLLFGNRVRPERARKRRLTELAAWHPYPDEPARALTAVSPQVPWHGSLVPAELMVCS